MIGDVHNNTICLNDTSAVLPIGKEYRKRDRERPNFNLTLCVPAPSNRSPLEAFVDLKVAGGDLLESPGR